MRTHSSGRIWRMAIRFAGKGRGVYHAPRMDSGVLNRVRLWLRTEKQWGLRSVAVPAPDDQTPVQEEIHPAGVPAEAFPPDPPREGSGDVMFAVAKQEDVRPVERVRPRSETGLLPPAPDAPAFDAPVLTAEQKCARLLSMDDKEVRGCTKCRLCETRTNTVFGEGAADAELFFIGEGPGETEDLTGRPFVGKAGEQLSKWIAAMGLTREQVYIANIVKCRPPGNRVPAPDEVATCTPYLQRQLEIIRPRVIMTLGLPSTKYMLQSNLSMGRLRGRWHEWRGIRLMPTYHPAYVLRQYTLETRSAVWNDLKQVMAELGLPEPKKGA